MSKIEEERLREAERLANDPKAIDEVNQRVIKEFRANQGKVGGMFEGMPVLLMTMTGAKTGRTLTRPVCYTRDGGAIVIIASYGGNPHNPPWYHNLVANPVITVEVGAEKFKAKAVVTSGKERQRLFDQMAKQMSFFADYQKKTKRQIPVLVLNRVE
ncbi:MAG TPA: nitroreductase family deazaflavin-dependent oxidoreductase [Candidatus Binataceae bacterium]|nr:nitroreductase family deazaflavin-dependent oxidoreductase [Candidatus Binataceae bacterium]